MIAPRFASGWTVVNRLVISLLAMAENETPALRVENSKTNILRRLVQLKEWDVQRRTSSSLSRTLLTVVVTKVVTNEEPEDEDDSLGTDEVLYIMPKAHR